MNAMSLPRDEIHRVLVVEDEPQVREGLVVNLRAEGFEVDAVGRGDEVLERVLALPPHLIVLDIMLPGVTGIDVCRELRARGYAGPIIFLTARTQEIDRVLGLEIGADDYVVKPFSVRELIARIRARLRRLPVRTEPPLPQYRVGDVHIDFERHRADKAGTPLEMTPREFGILQLLIRHRGHVISRDLILDEVWGADVSVTSRTIDNYILRLRQKLEPTPADPRIILTVYGEGYKFVG